MRAAALLALLPFLAFAEPVVLPSPVRLGETEVATLRFELPGCAQAQSRADVSVNVGDFGPVRQLQSGTWEAQYTPPSTRFPQMALVAIFCEHAPDQMTFVRVPLYGRTTLPVTAQPGSTIEVEVGEETFGPVNADGRGKAALPIWVPPGVKEAIVVGRDRRGVRSQARVKVDVPPYNRLTVVVTPRNLPADGKTAAHVVAHYDGASSVSPEEITASANVGQLSLERAEDNAVFYRYLPPDDADLGPAKLRLQFTNDAASLNEVEIALREPEIPPGRFSLGARVGFAHGLGDVIGPRVGLHAWYPFQLLRRNVALGVDLSFGGASQALVDPLGTAGEASTSFVPLTLRLGYELQRGPRHWFHAGVGAQFVYARYAARFAAVPGNDLALGAFGGGPLAFGSAALALGPGEAFADLSFAFAPVSARAFSVQTGGFAFAAGYRLSLLR